MSTENVVHLKDHARLKRQRLLRETISRNLELGAEHMAYTESLEHEAIVALIEDLYMALDTLTEELGDRYYNDNSDPIGDLIAAVQFLEQWFGRYEVAS